MRIKHILIIGGIASMLAPAIISAQDAQTSPKPVVVSSVPPAAPGDTTPLAPGLEHLKGIVILGTTNDFKPEGYPGVSGALVKSPLFLKEHQAMVDQVVKPFLGQPLTATAMTNLQIQLILLCRKLDRPVVDVFFPGNRQEIVDTVQIMVFEGKLDHVAVTHEGRAWFNDRMLNNQIHLKPGDSILQSQLLQDVSRLNLNPRFREVSVVYMPGEADKDGHGTTTVDLDVKEQFPFQVFAGVDDYGLKILGEDQVFGGFYYGNVFGADQVLDYKYTTDTGFDRLRQHIASYEIPLPWWGNRITISGNYSEVRPDLSEIGFAPIKYNNGHTYQLSLRYLIPLPHVFGIIQDVGLGFDYKDANTPATFGKIVVHPYDADIDQFAIDYHATLFDPIGFTELTGSGYYSPGGLVGKNTDSDFASFGPPLKADYYYGRITAERDFDLFWSRFFRAKGGFQDASTGLLPSEDLYLGGYQLLRGYPESVESGDEGGYASLELHSPNLLSHVNLTGQHLPHVDSDMLDIFGFFDYGSVKPIYPNVGSTVTMDSAGGGLNYSLSQNFQLNVAYGFQLKDLPAGTPTALTKDKSRLHLSATVLF